MIFRTVYKCIDDNNNVRCIKRIKLINTSNVATNAHFELIQHEIYLLQNLMHPRIISLHDYFYSKDCKYIHIVMEHAIHGPLSKLITDRHIENSYFDETVSAKNRIDQMLITEYLIEISIFFKIENKTILD